MTTTSDRFDRLDRELARAAGSPALAVQREIDRRAERRRALDHYRRQLRLATPTRLGS